MARVPVCVVAAVVLAVGLASCSSSSATPSAAKSSTSTTTTGSTSTGSTSTSGAATTSTTAVASPDTAIAARAALTLADLPGYTSVPAPEPTAAQVAQNRAFANCVGADPELVDTKIPPGEVERLFVDGNINVANTVHLFASAADAAPRFDAYTRPATPACLESLFKSQLTAGAAQQHVEIGAVTAVPLAVTVHAAQSVAFRLTAPLSTPQAQLNEYVDLVAAMQGRTVVLVEASTSGQPYGASADAALVNKVLGRLPST